MTNVAQRVENGLRNAPGDSPWESLMSLFKADREAFYLLACDGVRSDASSTISELADLARKVREAVRGSYQIEPSDDGAHLVGWRPVRAFIPRNLIDNVRTFLMAVDGKGVQDGSGRDYEGTVVSEAEVRFQLGDRATWEAERALLQERLSRP